MLHLHVIDDMTRTVSRDESDRCSIPLSVYKSFTFTSALNSLVPCLNDKDFFKAFKNILEYKYVETDTECE